MRVAIIENTIVTHHGQMGVALHMAGARIDLYKPWAGHALPDPGDHDALVVFGGEQTALDDHTHPYMPDLCALIRDTSAMDRAVLGICLGAQLTARAFGGQNHIGTAPEFGWCDVTLTGAGRADPVLAALPATFPIFQWHSDTFTLPDGATPLATSPAAPQAFRMGRATYATQFHFEANRAVVADWAHTFPDLIDRIKPGWLSARAGLAQTVGAAADDAGLAIASAWISLI